MRLAVFTLFLFAQSIYGLYDSSDDVIELTSSNFDRIKSEDGILLAEFYSPGCVHCRNLAPEWKRLASATKGLMKVGAVDVQQHGDIGSKYGISGYPTIKIFLADKSAPIDYNGGRQAAQILAEVMRLTKSHVESKLGGGSGKSSGGGSSEAVQTLTDTDFDKHVLKSELPWMVGFFADWCGHCKNLKPHWKEAARELEGKVNFGEIEASVNKDKATEYQINSFPTLKFFPAGSSSASDAIPCDGVRDKESIVSWVLQHLESSIPDPEVVEIVSQESFDANCKDHTICVISVLPSLYDCDPACRNKYLELLADEAKEFKKQKWGWLWSEALKQEEFERGLNIGGSGYPTMVAIHLKKMKRVTLFGSFSQSGVHSFLFSLSVGGGKLPLSDVKVVPKLIKTEPWNGEPAPALEDDGFEDEL